MHNNQITVVIPIFNQSEFLKDAVVSACEQTVIPGKIIIVDDGSTDQTSQIAQELIQHRQDVPIEYRRFSKSSGIGESFHRAVMQAETEFVVKLDADDILSPQFIEKLVLGLEKHKNAGWAHCNVQETTPSLRPTRLAHALKPSGYEPPHKLLPMYIKRNDTCHCVVLRRLTYLNSGGYSPSMKTCEDWHLWLCMILEGAGAYYDFDVLATMRKHPVRYLMSERNRGYVESISWMFSDLKLRFPEYDDLLGELYFSASRHCFGAFLQEKDSATERMLLDCYLVYPTATRRAACFLAKVVSKRGVRLCRELIGFPKKKLREALIKKKIYTI